MLLKMDPKTLNSKQRRLLRREEERQRQMKQNESSLEKGQAQQPEVQKDSNDATNEIHSCDKNDRKDNQEQKPKTF